jgi:hypothetical protein
VGLAVVVAAFLLAGHAVARLAPADWSLTACQSLATALAVATYVVIAATPLAWGSTDPAVAAAVLCGLSLLAALVARRAREPTSRRRWATRREAGLVALALVMAALNRDPIAYYTLDGDNAVYAVRALQLWKEGEGTTQAVAASTADTGHPRSLWLPGTHAAPGDSQRYQFHALPAWPLVMALALWAGGLDHQFDAQLLLYLLVVTLGLSLLSKLAGRRRALPLGILLATSPLVLFFSRYTTAELLALLLGLTALRCWSSGIVVFRMVAVVPLVALAFTHLSFMLLLPIAGIAAVFGLARVSAADVYALGALQVAVAQLVALPYYPRVSPQYLADTFRNLFGSMPAGNWFLGVLAGVIAAVAAVALVEAYRRPGPAHLVARATAWVLERCPAAVIPVGAAILLGAVGVSAYRLAWTDAYLPQAHSEWNSWSARAAYVDRGASSLLHLSLTSVTFAGSVVVTLIAIGSLFRPIGPGLARRHSLVQMSLLYALAVFTVVRVDIPNNYYASRYLLPMLFPLLYAAAAQAMRSWRLGLVWSIALAGALGFNLYHAAALIRADFYSTGATPYRWLEERVPVGSTLLVVGDDWLRRTFALQARLLVGNAVEVVPESRLPERLGGGGAANVLVLATTPLTAEARCLRYPEARIPWQILYPTKATLVERRICVTPGASAARLGDSPASTPPAAAQ